MLTKILVLTAYFTVVIILGLLAKSRLKEGPADYFLAGRGLGTFVLMGTMAATNFSAFTVFGASGAGYRDGLSFFPIMAFGTGFMALTFWLLGRKVWQWGRTHQLVTPAELVEQVYGNKWLAALFALAMVVFTVPYLALQPLAGAKVLGQLFGLPPWAGASLITAIILVYTLRGGLKAVAWTDVFQGLLMFILMAAALFMVTSHFGGWSQAFSQAREAVPELFSRPGPRGVYTPAVWFSFLALWFFCDPMFPQLFQRFYSAKKERSLARTMALYPLICTLVFALPVAMGVLGHLAFPGLAGRASDNIVPLLMTRLAGDFMGTLVLAAGLAALMSTMDSQLLTLSSIFSRDLFPLIRGRKSESSLVGRVFVLCLALAGLLVALVSDATILSLGLTAFTGLAVLFPTVFFGLYLKKPRPAAGIASILVGEALVVAYHLKLLPSGGFLPAMPAIAASVVVYLAVQLLSGGLGLPRFTRRGWLALILFGGVFALAQDYWAWGRVGGSLAGWPLWAWYFVGLSALQTLFIAWWLRTSKE
ncbi:MAG: sodium:solute symporter family protein [Desulfarculaceae bacterium]|nr:sodium:solute symporter family protein [Desulfarculaceae bacterium]MCF8072153.1 sodium:solute symporter family protein [Desulfarculaceae bacterium]MCF8100074.1 sodium:solute symporter family protein [Desulfarculaceae bacterium]MCF8118499.1 sodium:solute symporter family protein [Desulfarculaceae bacterium]